MVEPPLAHEFSPAETHLSDEQRARIVALSEANEVLGQHDKQVDATDLVAVASWVIDGRNPWTEG